MDDEVKHLLEGELEKHLVSFEPGSGFDVQRRALHTLKGSFGLAEGPSVLLWLLRVSAAKQVWRRSWALPDRSVLARRAGIERCGTL